MSEAFFFLKKILAAWQRKNKQENFYDGLSLAIDSFCFCVFVFFFFFLRFRRIDTVFVTFLLVLGPSGAKKDPPPLEDFKWAQKKKKKKKKKLASQRKETCVEEPLKKNFFYAS